MCGSNSEEHICLSGDEQVDPVIRMNYFGRLLPFIFSLSFKLPVNSKYSMFLLLGNTLATITPSIIVTTYQQISKTSAVKVEGT